MSDNPVLIQPYKCPPGGAPNIPLVLFHDGGGTIFSYFLLRKTGREVWGIENPRLASGERWNGGMAEMAREYANGIRLRLRPGPLILGGWSFGGSVALEVASILATEGTGHTVAGMVFVDTSYPALFKDCPAGQVPQCKVPFKDNVPLSRRVMVQRSMDEAVRMLRDWDLPDWSELTTARAAPPPTVVLRAAESTFLGQRRSEKLGWERYPYEFVRSVVTVGGQHFTLFEEPHIQDVSRELTAACNLLEREGLRS